MKWLEIIEIRSVGNQQELLQTQLENLLNDIGQEQKLLRAKVYRHVTLETDISIHLYFDSVEIEINGNSVTIQLISALREFGLINHTVWVEQFYH